MVWKPHVTVAAIIENNNRFLLVEEETSKGLAFNQPAGHLEKGEDLVYAVKREVFEETAGRCHSHDPAQTLDDGIIATHWLTREEVAAKNQQLRSPLVLISIDEFLSGARYPLSLLQSFLDLDT